MEEKRVREIWELLDGSRGKIRREGGKIGGKVGVKKRENLKEGLEEGMRVYEEEEGEEEF